jgi:hypothetical protein
VDTEKMSRMMNSRRLRLDNGLHVLLRTQAWACGLIGYGVLIGQNKNVGEEKQFAKALW